MKKIIFSLALFLIGSNVVKAQIGDASNQQNEYDNYGKIHNLALSKIISTAESRNEFQKDWIATTKTSLEENTIDPSPFLEMLNEEKCISELGKANFHQTKPLTKDDIKTYESKKQISKYVSVYLTEILNNMDEFELNNDFNSFMSNMIKTENSISNLTKDYDRVFLLSTASVARYSTYFWKDFKSNETTDNYNKVSPRGLAAADVGGAVAGGVRFGILAFFGGPVGWGLAGSAILAGGIAASVGYAIAAQFWP
jgi:hypothetical protein